MTLGINLFGQNHTVDNSLKMTCVEKHFDFNVTASVHPGRYGAKVSFTKLG